MDEWAGDFDGGSRECVSRVRVGCGGCRGSRGQGGGGKNEKWGQDRNMTPLLRQLIPRNFRVVVEV